jgi:hypothetical protein
MIQFFVKGGVGMTCVKSDVFSMAVFTLYTNTHHTRPSAQSVKKWRTPEALTAYIIQMCLVCTICASCVFVYVHVCACDMNHSIK